MTDQTPADDVRKVISSHGYAFQYAVLRRAAELFDGGSSWVFEVAEFPVGDGDNATHIDFILKGQTSRIYLVAECKRVDPALSRWCFVKAPLTRRNAYPNELVFQEVTSTQQVHPPLGPSEYATGSKPRTTRASIAMAHLGFELRSPMKGDGSSTGRGTINDAATQVLRGMNGFVDYLFAQRTTNAHIGRILLVPAVFTTASLWIADGDMSEADLTTGQLPADWATITSVPWLWFNYNQSPTLRHRLPPVEPLPRNDISAVLHAEYTRTIAVVSPAGFDAFLKTDLASWLY